jgi:catechol 2,3-dioxygenase-like lactoylglutathione lyase family enzyme
MTMTDTLPLITGVDFVCIPAQDFDAMTAFYGETLGLPFVRRWGSRAGAGVCWQAICLDPDGNQLSLHHRYAPADEAPATQDG